MTNIPKIALTTVLACGLVSPALADHVGADWISLDQAAQKAMAAGYTNISKIKADDGRWEGQGMKDGKNLEFHMDPKTGSISDGHPDN